MRTEKTILNMLSDTIPFFLMGLLGFIKIRVFIYYLGDDFYGFSQLFLQVFSYLNLAEAGFGTAIVYALYKPIVNKDRDRINRLLSGARIIFRRIGIVILIIGAVLSFFMDYMIKGNPASYLYTQIVFIIYLITSTGNYFVFAPRFLLQADQNKYLINWVTNTVRMIQMLTEIVLLMLGFDLMVIFISYFIFMIITNTIINKLAYKKYPWINVHGKPDFSTYANTQHVMMHKIGSIIALNTDNIMLSAFVGIDMVAVYASYNYIIQFIISITGKIINSTQESFGNFFAMKDKKEGISAYWEMNALLFYMGSIIFTVTYLSINNFILLWLGSDYLVSNTTVLLFCVIFFYRIVRGTSVVIVNGVGAFKETKWQALFEGLINLGLSLALVSQFEINGILFATIISYLATGFWAVPNYIFKNVFHQPVRKYYINYMMNVLIMIVILFIFKRIVPVAGVYQNDVSLLQWFIESTVVTMTVGAIYFCIYYAVFKHFRLLVQRFVFMAKKRSR
ncbi:MAG: lipopolysaccharide biosynthesis protein [Eubacteriales bacterium]